MNKALMKNYADTFMDKVAVIHSAFDETPKTVAFVRWIKIYLTQKSVRLHL